MEIINPNSLLLLGPQASKCALKSQFVHMGNENHEVEHIPYQLYVVEPRVYK